MTKMKTPSFTILRFFKVKDQTFYFNIEKNTETKTLFLQGQKF